MRKVVEQNNRLMEMGERQREEEVKRFEGVI